MPTAALGIFSILLVYIACGLHSLMQTREKVLENSSHSSGEGLHKVLSNSPKLSSVSESGYVWLCKQEAAVLYLVRSLRELFGCIKLDLQFTQDMREREKSSS